jgi:hypothetical protein
VIAAASPSAWCFVIAPLITTSYLLLQLFQHPWGRSRGLRLLLGVAILGAGIDFLLALLDADYWLAALAVVAGFLVAYFGERRRSALLSRPEKKEPQELGLLLLEITVSVIWLLGGLLSLIGH